MIIRNLLLIVVCLSFLHPAAQAQRTSLDVQVLNEMMENRHEDPVEIYQQISNTTNYISMLAPITVLATGLVRNDRVTLNKGFYMAESLAASSFITTGLKYAFKRHRPFADHPFIVPASNGGSPSFPSGHTSEAFATATSLTMAYPKWYVAVPAYAWASSVGYSRMYLGVHYPSDVLAGAIVGAGSAWLMYRVNKWLVNKKPATALVY
ncbi:MULTISPECIES: phosphatase PAP2 family protein [Niastella]|uniref:Phosphatase PAP2 family protein n=1 Tax=Niastella soli TaxID=2821487 RepID=A0ABS3Z311_9BACT|nr:phosphatase PAP2 family protein [Niastella soli]MBO9204562.1 phosphatase PAP2 family protein [Niastella soli]